ncbi:ABC transporter ATP-binding protein [Halalkalicoccus ordinarius]|uniref:ABC transporter ATP-binding protein n=1 Tax=Halalkalicoccus ordinarius TaxID=3116651 RepID=UPI00300E7482
MRFSLSATGWIPAAIASVHDEGSGRRAVTARAADPLPGLHCRVGRSSPHRFGALDVSLRIEMMDLMHDLQRAFDTSYLFISHDLANAYYFAGKVGGRIGIMYLGKLVEIGTAEEIIRNPRHPYTKVLRWATPVMDPDAAREATMEVPMRKIDIPDPKNPPSGCRFHTRCPKAREVCTGTTPRLRSADREDSKVACFRAERDHEYWNSEPLPE